ncbi:MAG: hypothetical protein R3195_06600 [Gemmatimonadota bacterium]|nr:hypothetical protein [Gemmatimonadota bacterium]
MLEADRARASCPYVATIAASLMWVAGLTGQEVCEPDRPPEGQIAIEALECVTPAGCAVNERDERGWFHSFTVEPAIVAMREGSKARSPLRVGDVIVAVAGHLITTAEGGRILANVQTGVPVTLRVRRPGGEHDLRVIPEPGCNVPRLTVREPRK